MAILTGPLAAILDEITDRMAEAVCDKISDKIDESDQLDELAGRFQV